MSEPPETSAEQAPAGEPWTVTAPPPPDYAHVVELVEHHGVTDAVYERHGDRYVPTDEFGGSRHRGSRSWRALLGLAWAQELAVRVCPLGYARHAPFGAVRVQPPDRERGRYAEEVVVAGPPVNQHGDAARWVSLTSPGRRFTDDDVDTPPWKAMDREAAWRHMIPPDPT